MPFSVTSAAIHSNRICRKTWFFYQIRNFSASCNIETLQFVEDEGNTIIDENSSKNPNFYYKELQSRMQKYAVAGFCREALYTLNLMRNVPGKPTVYDYNSFMYYYLKSANVSIGDLVEMYVGMIRFGPFPNALTFNTLLNGLLSVGTCEDVLCIAEEMYNSGFTPSFRSLSRLLKKSLKCGNLVDSINVLEFMLRLDYFPTGPTLNLFISGLCRVGRIREAYYMYSVLSDKGFFSSGSVYICNPILWAFCKSNQNYVALAFFCSLKKKGLIFNVCSYTALIHGFCRIGLWEDVFRILDEMQHAGCKPNVITYTTVIKFLCDAGKINEVLHLLDAMESKGCDPDLITYNVILRMLCRQNRTLEAYELVRTIDQKGLSPNQFTYTALAGGLLKAGRTKIASELLLDIFAGGCVVDVVTYNIYLHALCCEGKSREALTLVNSMMEKGFSPSNVTYNTILNGFCRECNMDEALELFDHFEWATNGPDLVSFNTIISAACKIENSSMIRRVLYRMEFEGVKLDVIGATCLIQYFGAAGKFSECFNLLESMIKNGPSPTLKTYNVLLDSLCKKGLLGTAFWILRDFRNAGLFPDTTSYNILLHASIRQRHDLVEQLLWDMFSQRLTPDAVTYGTFINGLSKKGKISTALLLLDQMLDVGLTPGIGIYNAILEAMFRRGKLWDIFLILKEMAIKGCELDMISFDILNRAMSKGGLKRDPAAMKALEFVMKNYNVREPDALSGVMTG